MILLRKSSIPGLGPLKDLGWPVGMSCSLLEFGAVLPCGYCSQRIARNTDICAEAVNLTYNAQAADLTACYRKPPVGHHRPGVGLRPAAGFKRLLRDAGNAALAHERQNPIRGV